MRAPRPRTVHSSALVWLALGLAATQLGGCVTVKYKVEFDRMTGTAYPPAQTVAGATVDLESIYKGAGKTLTVDEDDTNLAPLTGPADPTDPGQYDYITEAELDTLEGANRSLAVGMTSCGDKCNEYHLYGVVVDHWYEQPDGVRKQGVMGIMWADDCRAFAMFHKNTTVTAGGGKYLRSASHEIGHAFNLHHSDGDGSATIMNQTWKVGSSFTYTFSSDSDAHLKTHAVKCRRPGISTWGSVGTTHDDHGWLTQDCI